MRGRWGLLLAVLATTVACGTGGPDDFATVRATYTSSDAYLLDRRGDVLHVSRMDFERRRAEWTALAEISASMRRHVVNAEDKRFFSHHGVDWTAIGGAAWARAAGERRRGGSTLSMQVAAILDPALAPGRHGRSIAQKVKQIGSAMALERHWTKAQILEAYLNLADFRGETAGIGSASAVLLGKHPSGIDDVDAALLVALLPAPNVSAETLARRACRIARDVRDCTRYERAAERLVRRRDTPLAPPAYAPELARRLLHRAGERVATTLDLALQRDVRTLLTAQLGGLVERNVRDGAAIVLDNATGEVLAWVGSAGPYSTARHVDGVRALRQAGSTLKPFLYGLAFDRRVLTAASILDDSPLALDTGAGLYIPSNYDRDFRGAVSARTALAASLNVPAVRTLLLVGVDRFRDALRSFGYRSVTEEGDFYGYSLALGSADVSLLEQTNAYRMLANGGELGEVRIMPDDEVRTRRVMSTGAAFIVADVLSDRGSRAPTFGLDNALATRHWSAVKTGTSKGMRDNWCIGWSPGYTVGVWVGNFEGDPMHDVSGVTGAAPAWLAIMNRLHGAESIDEPSPPDTIVRTAIRFDPALEPPRDEWFLRGTALSVVRAVETQRRPQIASPPDGAIVALDPDIPAARQLVTVVVSGGTPAHRIELDGRRLGTADTPRRVPPTPGSHVISLFGPNGDVLDAVRFEVRPFARWRRCPDCYAERRASCGAGYSVVITISSTSNTCRRRSAFERRMTVW
jgi:penicillin-binding protein 1C